MSLRKVNGRLAATVNPLLAADMDIEMAVTQVKEFVAQTMAAARESPNGSVGGTIPYHKSQGTYQPCRVEGGFKKGKAMSGPWPWLGGDGSRPQRRERLASGHSERNVEAPVIDHSPRTKVEK